MADTVNDTAPLPGDLPQIARITGTSLSLVRKVSVGQRRNEKVTWAISRANQLRNAMWEQLEKEFAELQKQAI